MKESKTIKILKSLNKKEIIEVGYFVDNPFFNKRSKTKELFTLLLDFYPKFNGENLTSEYLCKKLFF